MNIVMLSWRGPHHPRAGGAEVYTEHLLQGLAARGHRVDWYSGGYTSEPPAACGDIRLHYGAAGMKVYVSGFHYASRLRDADVIIDQLNTFGFLTPLLRTGAKRVTLIHQLAADVWDYETRPPVSWIGKRMEAAMLRQYRKQPFITVSESTLEDLLQLGWAGEHEIIPNGISLGRPCPKSPVPRLVFLARFGARAKRISHAIEVFRQVRAVFPDTELHVIGRGTPPPEAYETGITIHQGISDAQRDQLLGEAWCCLATSVREGWGRMVLESAAQGTPSVVYRVPGLRDAVVDGVTGHITDETPEAMATAIIALFHDRERLDRFGRQAYETAAAYTWERSIDRFARFLEDRVLGAKP